MGIRKEDAGLPAWMRAILIAVGALLFLTTLALLPIIPVQPYLDFQVLYQTNMGLLRGIPVYDHAAQVQMVAQLAGVAPQQVFMLPFPYPPWYALVTAWLAWLPIDTAARVWFGINLLLLFGSIVLLSEGWPLLKRVAALAAGFFFLPVLGSLLVGQYSFPLLLGAALMVYSLRSEKALLTAVAAALLTFKPHLGALICIAVLIHLWMRKDRFGRQAILYMLMAGGVLFIVGFLADPAWPIDYARSLIGFQNAGEVATCALCAGLPAMIAYRLRPDEGLRLGLVIGAAIFILLAALWAGRQKAIIHRPALLIAVACATVLLASPYLLNYDFLLLLVPLALLAGTKQTIGRWILIAIAYVLPFAAVGIFGRQGNIAFSLCAAISMAMLYWQAQWLDGSPSSAYNHLTIS